MAEATLPTVTALVAAYNYERYVGEAVESALHQEYPPELLDVVVVDDGSEDGTAAVVGAIAARNPGRVKLIRQENAGATAALNRARRDAAGELLGLLDADDVWLPAKIRRQVERFKDRRDLYAVFCDMTIIDGDGNPGRPLLGDESQAVIARLSMRTPGQFAQLLWGNFATHSSVLVRAELFDQIPAAIPYADWWLTLAAARRSGLDFIPEPLALYRIHGANLTGGVSGASMVREKVKSLAFRFWVLRHLELEGLPPADAAFIWDQGIEATAGEALRAAESLFTRLVDVDAEARARAVDWLEQAMRSRAAGDHEREMIAILKSLAWNPYQLGGRALLHEAVGKAQEAAAAPHPLAGARSFVMLVDAEDLLDGDSMLLTYAKAVRGISSTTLAIDASRLGADEAAAKLERLIERCGLTQSEDVDMIAFTDPLDPAQAHRVRVMVNALYAPSAPARESLVGQLWSDGGVPAHTPETLAQALPALVAERDAAAAVS